MPRGMEKKKEPGMTMQFVRALVFLTSCQGGNVH
jgi:hypothetical protein